MLKLAFRNLFRQTGRTLMTLTVVAFGVIGIILSGGFVQDIYVQLRDATIHSRLGHIQIYEEGYYRYGRRDPGQYLIESPGKLSEQLESLPQVDMVLQRLTFSGLLSNGRTDLPIMGEGVQPSGEAALGDYVQMVAGRQLRDADELGILLGEGVAESLRLSPGSYVNVFVSTPGGGLNSLEFQVVGVFRTFSKDFDDRAVRIPLDTAQYLLDTSGVHALVLVLHETERTAFMSRYLDAQLAPHGFEIFTWLELDDFYQKTVAVYEDQFGVLQLIILLIVILSVLSSVTMTMNERVGEFGTLRALGYRSRDLFMMVVVENSLLGLVAAALGLVVGLALAHAISAIGIPMPPPPNSNSGYTAYIRVVPQVLFIAFVIGVVTTIVAAVFAGRKPTRMNIVEALRRNV